MWTLSDYSLVVHGLHHPGLALPEHLLLLLLVRRRLRKADLQRRAAQVAPVQLLKNSAISMTYFHFNNESYKWWELRRKILGHLRDVLFWNWVSRKCKFCITHKALKFMQHYV